MSENTATKHFQFSYKDTSPGYEQFPEGKIIDVSMSFDEGITWDAVMREFVQFLGHCWGYDISEKVDYDTLEKKIDRLNKKLGEDDDEEIKTPDWM